MKCRKVLSLSLLLAAFCLAAPARAEGPAARLRIDAQFDQARAAEFRKFAGEDEGVAQARLRQAADLERNAEQYFGRARFHSDLAARYNSQEQRDLAAAAQSLGAEMRKFAVERRNMGTTVQQHVNQWRTWATALDAKAQRELQMAAQLENAGKL